MSRKDRRANERRAAGLRTAVPSTQSPDADALFTQAASLDRTGDASGAQKILRGVLARHPQHVASLILAGDIAHREGRNNAAIKLLGQAIALDPDNAYAHDCMAMACQSAGRQADAVEHFTRAIALGLGGVEGLIRQSPVVAGALSRLSAAWPRQLNLPELLGPGGAAALAADALLMALLRSKASCDLDLERLLTAIRRALLEQVSAGQVAVTDSELDFFAALAEQCFINEYVFALGERERELSSALARRVADAGAAAIEVPALHVAAMAMYVSLHELPNAQELAQRPWSGSILRLIRQQVQEPREEIDDRANIPVLTPVDDAVSVKVQAQYEQNPYPRWTTMARPKPALVGDYLRERLGLGAFPVLHMDAPVILVAGCGTGAHSIETAQRFPTSNVLAIDISLASLAYARRKTREAGLTNIEYAQADILRLGTLERRFDVIEASGVLHHLADPVAGWRILLSLLRPGGVMLVGLYSALARRPVNAVRAMIAERGFPPTADGIRACRAEMLQRRIGTVSADFFTTSRCRDLYFHPMEHQFEIGGIKSILDGLGLRFLGFEVPPEIRPEAEQAIPASAWADLDRWAAFEQAHPRTFVAMYQFWVLKPA